MTRPDLDRLKPADLTVFERFAKIARAYPDALAYVHGTVSLNYAQLAAKAEAVRRHILAAGPAAPGFVAILTADRVHALTAFLGAAGSGHAYVPLDANDPDNRLALLLADVGPFAILTDAALRPRAESLAGGKATIIDLDNLGIVAGGAAAGPPVSPDSLLYVSYTSGSTGVPKGVCQTHRNLIFFVDAYIAAMELGAGDRISWLFAPGASASNMDIYGAVFSGAQLCPFDLKTQSFAILAQWLDDRGIAVLHTVPTVARELVRAIPRERMFDSVRVIDLAGEMLFASDVARMRPHFPPGCRILNRLAATEASFIASLEVTAAHDSAEGALPVGKPIDGVEIAIVRDDGALADAGETGAIAIASRHLCTGYIKRPDLDAEHFSDLAGRPGWRQYRSADLGFIDRAGDLHFIGRSGSRIKLRGQAVDLAEVETALYDCPGVTGAVVLPRAEAGAEAREIIAYLTLAEGAAREAGDIRKQLAQALPAYMLPSGYVFLDSFPSTATAKTDRAALAALDLSQVRFRPGYVPPEDAIEERVAAIFAEVLGCPAVGRFDDFFLLGGDSLALVNLQILATDAFGRQFSGLHEDATVKGIAQALRDTDTGDEIYAPIVLPIRTAGSAPPLFIVHGRRGQAHVGPQFLALLGPDQPLYALQARGLDGRHKPHQTIAAMAADYVAAIRTVQPHGPYFLGGLCAGCFVTLEMVRLLRQQGETIYPPLLIDPPPDTSGRIPADAEEEILIGLIKRRVQSGVWSVDLHNARAVNAAVAVARAFENALEAYRPQPLPVRAMVIAAMGRWRSQAHVMRVFGDQVRVFLINSVHLELLAGENRPFADAVRACVANVAKIAAHHRASQKAPPARVRGPVAAEGAPD